MIIFESLDFTERFYRPVLTIGNYDGVHVGHRTIIERVKAKARPMGGTSILMTFDPHPLALIKPESLAGLISPVPLKKKLIAETGIDVLLIVPFTEQFRSIEPEDYVKEILVGKIGIEGLIVGYDFRFGKKGRGDVGLLRELAEKYGFFFEMVEAITLHGEKIGSNRIRHMLVQGETEKAMEFLGRPYSIEGRVIKGFGRGRGIGFPTVNIETSEGIVPAEGVYATRLAISGRRLKGVTNIGFNPTFEGKALTIETHILDFHEDLYGAEVTLSFYRRLRGEIRFENVEQLKARIATDVAEARSYLDGVKD